MNWEDTVIRLDDDIKQHNLAFQYVLKSQAQITWDIAKQAGMKEVVDWVNEQTDFVDDEPCPYYVLNKKVWQAFLKEKGYERTLRKLR